jgi:hypothetical protein
VIHLALLLAALDGGASMAPPPKDPPPKSAEKKLSPEDQEVIRMMELLENMHEAQDLELLQDLSLEQ